MGEAVMQRIIWKAGTQEIKRCGKIFANLVHPVPSSLLTSLRLSASAGKFSLILLP